MSGHNKWSGIKHRKGAQDAKRGKVFTRLIKEVTIAAREGGGDPGGNSRLRRAIDLARAGNMPKDTIDRAIKRGTGELDGVQYEELLYEGVGPSGALLVVNAVTDNRNRTAAEIRKVFDKHNGQLGASGSAAWAFEEKGLVKLGAEAATEEQLFDVAVGAGAEDLQNAGEEWIITTPREVLDVVRRALDDAGIAVESATLEKLPKTVKLVEGRDAEVLIGLVEALEDHDDVQSVYADFELTEKALTALESA